MILDCHPMVKTLSLDQSGRYEHRICVPVHSFSVASAVNLGA